MFLNQRSLTKIDKLFIIFMHISLTSNFLLNVPIIVPIPNTVSVPKSFICVPSAKQSF